MHGERDTFMKCKNIHSVPSSSIHKHTHISEGTYFKQELVSPVATHSTNASTVNRHKSMMMMMMIAYIHMSAPTYLHHCIVSTYTCNERERRNTSLSDIIAILIRYCLLITWFLEYLKATDRMLFEETRRNSIRKHLVSVVYQNKVCYDS